MTDETIDLTRYLPYGKYADHMLECPFCLQKEYADIQSGYEGIETIRDRVITLQPHYENWVLTGYTLDCTCCNTTTTFKNVKSQQELLETLRQAKVFYQRALYQDLKSAAAIAFNVKNDMDRFMNAHFEAEAIFAMSYENRKDYLQQFQIEPLKAAALIKALLFTYIDNYNVSYCRPSDERTLAHMELPNEELPKV